MVARPSLSAPAPPPPTPASGSGSASGWGDPLLPPRQFKQKRAAVTYDALLEATARVFAEKGFAATQTPDIAAAAGVSTGAFYRYFTDKRQAFVEMVAQHLQRIHDEVMAELQPDRFLNADVNRSIDVALDVVFDSFARNAELNRVYLHMSLSDPEVEALRRRFEARGRMALAELIRQIVPAERVRSADAAALVLQVAVQEVAAECVGLRLTVHAAGGQAPSQAKVKRELREMIRRYLFPASPALPAPPAGQAK